MLTRKNIRTLSQCLSRTPVTEVQSIKSVKDLSQESQSLKPQSGSPDRLMWTSSQRGAGLVLRSFSVIIVTGIFHGDQVQSVIAEISHSHVIPAKSFKLISFYQEYLM